MRVRITEYIICFALFLYFFLAFDIFFHGPDEPLYLASTESIVEDGDLNIVNHIDPVYTYFFPNGKIGISKTYNVPDFHNHGGVIFWAPVYLYGKLSYFLLHKFNVQVPDQYSDSDLIRCALSFSTVFFAFLTLLLSYLFCRKLFSKAVSFWSVLTIFFGTPFFVFTLLETGNANILPALLAVVLIWCGSYAAQMGKRDLFFFGLFFSLCCIIKSELAFQWVFILLVFASLIINRQIKPLSNGYFFAGFIPGLILRLINDFIKYGTWHINELSSFNIKNWYFFEQLFSSYRGFFYTSPVLYLCLLGLIYASVRILKEQGKDSQDNSLDKFLLILSSYLIFKLLVLAFRFAWGGGTPGARILSTEFLVFVLLFARAFRANKYFKPILIFSALISVLWNFIMIYEYTSGVDMKHALHFPAPGVRVQELISMLRDLLPVRDLTAKLLIGLPLFLGASWAIVTALNNIKQAPINFWVKQKEKPPKLLKALAAFSIALFLAYLLVTMLNVFNNRNKVLKLQAKGFFENAEILSRREFEKLENLGSMNEMIEYFQAKGDLQRARQIEIRKNQFFGGTDNVR